MIITPKEILYITGYIITVISMIMSFKSIQKSQGKQIRNIIDIIFAEKGTLNVIDRKTFDTQLDKIWERIRNTENQMNMQTMKLDSMDKNILAIMIVLDIKVPKINQIKEDK